MSARNNLQGIMLWDKPGDTPSVLNVRVSYSGRLRDT